MVILGHSEYTAGPGSSTYLDTSDPVQKCKATSLLTPFVPPLPPSHFEAQLLFNESSINPSHRFAEFSC